MNRKFLLACLSTFLTLFSSNLSFAADDAPKAEGTGQLALLLRRLLQSKSKQVELQQKKMHLLQSSSEDYLARQRLPQPFLQQHSSWQQRQLV